MRQIVDIWGGITRKQTDASHGSTESFSLDGSEQHDLFPGLDPTPW
jgi:hypothetical protein